MDFIKGYIDFKQENNILEIGCGGDGLINYTDKEKRRALNPLMDYYSQILK